jgi:uncharacterized RDD family membrane protein YckC
VALSIGTGPTDHQRKDFRMDPVIAIQQPLTASTRPVSFAGFWKRFAAYLIDAIILSVMELIILLPFLGLLGIGLFTTDMEDPSTGFILALITTYIGAIVLTFMCGWLYFAILETMKQATPGKMIVGIKVTDMNGTPITFGRATGRYFAKIISSLTFGVGYIMAAFTQQKQALHDIISSCLVVDR